MSFEESRPKHTLYLNKEDNNNKTVCGKASHAASFMFITSQRAGYIEQVVPN